MSEEQARTSENRPPSRSRRVERIELAGYDPKYNMPFAQAIKISSGAIVFCAGITAAPIYHHHPHRDEEFDAVPLDAEGQARIVMRNLQNTLQAAGGDLNDVVQVTRFLTDMDRDQDAINQVYGEFFGAHRPTSTTVAVARLVHPKLCFEMNAIAVLPVE